MCSRAILLLAASLSAQEIKVYSEFTRIDPYGEVVRADRGAPPREILSPAIPRNAYTGYHVVVLGPPGASYTLHLGQNPENAVRATVYKETYVQRNGQWIPDGLQLVSLPYEGALTTPGIAGQKAQAFWLDAWVRGDAPVQRIKIEPQMYMAMRWIRYPMEGRVIDFTAPATAGGGPVSPASIDLASDAGVRQALCASSRAAENPLSVRTMIVRNAQQDRRMAGTRLWELIAAPDRAQWCAAYKPHPAGPEWYLRVRDRIFRSSDY